MYLMDPALHRTEPVFVWQPISVRKAAMLSTDFPLSYAPNMNRTILASSRLTTSGAYLTYLPSASFGLS